MGGLSIWHWMIVLVVVLLLFGTGKVSNLMGDFAKGIKAFKKNMAEDSDVSMEHSAAAPAATIPPPGTITQSGTQAATPAAGPRETTPVHHG